MCLGMVLGKRMGLTIVGLWDEEAESSAWDGGDCTKRERPGAWFCMVTQGGKVKVGGSGKWSSGRAF